MSCPPPCTCCQAQIVSQRLKFELFEIRSDFYFSSMVVNSVFSISDSVKRTTEYRPHLHLIEGESRMRRAVAARADPPEVLHGTPLLSLLRTGTFCSLMIYSFLCSQSSTSLYHDPAFLSAITTGRTLAIPEYPRVSKRAACLPLTRTSSTM